MKPYYRYVLLLFYIWNSISILFSSVSECSAFISDEKNMEKCYIILFATVLACLMVLVNEGPLGNWGLLTIRFGDYINSTELVSNYDYNMVLFFFFTLQVISLSAYEKKNDFVVVW